MIIGGADASIRVWNLEAKEQIGTLQEPKGQLADLSLAVAYAPDGASLAAGLADGRIRVIRPSPPGSTRCWQAHVDATAAVAYSADGRLLASSGYENTVKLWNPATGELAISLAGHQGWVLALAFSPDGQTLASAGYDRTVILWNVADGKPRLKLAGHAASIRALAFAHGKPLLASAAADGTIRLWDSQSGQEKAPLNDHQGVVRAVAFSADDRLLASGGEDRVVRLWNVEAGDTPRVPHSRLEKHADAVTALAFINGALVSGSLDHSLMLWDVAAAPPLSHCDTGSEVIALRRLPTANSFSRHSPPGRLRCGRRSRWSRRLWRRLANLERTPGRPRFRPIVAACFCQSAATETRPTCTDIRSRPGKNSSASAARAGAHDRHCPGGRSVGAGLPRRSVAIARSHDRPSVGLSRSGRGLRQPRQLFDRRQTVVHRGIRQSCAGLRRRRTRACARCEDIAAGPCR